MPRTHNPTRIPSGASWTHDLDEIIRQFRHRYFLTGLLTQKTFFRSRNHFSAAMQNYVQMPKVRGWVLEEILGTVPGTNRPGSCLDSSVVSQCCPGAHELQQMVHLDLPPGWFSKFVTKTGLFACGAAIQMLRYWSLQQRKGLSMREASEEMGEQVSVGLPKGKGFGIFMG